MSGTSVGENLEYGNGLPPIKVVIPALNEEKNVGRLIDQIMAENVPCDIVVSDNASEDGTGKVVLERQARYRESRPEVAIELVYVPERGVAIARNVGALHGWNKKTYEYIFFLDADDQLPSGFFHRAIQEMEVKGLDAAGCLLLPETSKFVDQLVTDIYNNVLRVMECTGNHGCVGAGMVATPEMFAMTGGFDPEMKVYEDTDWAKRAGKIGKAGMLSTAPIIFSSRRMEKDGRLSLYTTYLIGGLYYLFTGKARKGMKYEFGKY